jgi:demethylmenaquinone methyltransferase/2-methoxy-6-polyprenyl-1,4-benzoquinol methylase
MDETLRRSMLRYYDERASEYEDAYVRGTGTASIPDPDVFRREALQLSAHVGRFARGRMLDLACGTGFWLPYYAQRCSTMTLFDQSAKMLDECRTKSAALGVSERCSIVQGDVLDVAFSPASYDSALVGFLLSHVTEEQEYVVFETLRSALDASGRFLILDSAFSPERARFNSKIERQPRELNDGTRFEIYKRYLDRDDIVGWGRRYGATLSIEYFGTVFVAVQGRFCVAD